MLSHVIRYTAAAPLSPPLQPKIAVLLGRGTAIVRSPDILADPRYGKSGPYFGMPKGHLPVRSYLAVPVTARSGAVLDGLFFGHPLPGMFTERAERLVTAIATQAAVAIDNGMPAPSASRATRARTRSASISRGFTPMKIDA